MTEMRAKSVFAGPPTTEETQEFRTPELTPSLSHSSMDGVNSGVEKSKKIRGGPETKNGKEDK